MSGLGAVMGSYVRRHGTVRATVLELATITRDIDPAGSEKPNLPGYHVGQLKVKHTRAKGSTV